MQIRDLILRLKKMGKTVIFSSHLLEQVQEVADRVAIFSLGRKVLEGSLDDLLVERQATLVNLPGELSAERRDELQRVLAQAGFSGADVSFSRPRLSLETALSPHRAGGQETMIGSLHRIIIIARNTLTEAVRQKVLTVLLLFGVVMICTSSFFSQVVIDQQIKFVKDFGCGAIGLIGLFIALLSTAQLLPQELHNRTIYTILAKPVRRAEFLFGKFFGVVLLLALSVALMSLAFAATLWWQEAQGIAATKASYATNPKWESIPDVVSSYHHDVDAIVAQVHDPAVDRGGPAYLCQADHVGGDCAADLDFFDPRSSSPSSRRA